MVIFDRVNLGRLAATWASCVFALSLSVNVLAAYGTDFLDAIDAFESGDYEKAVDKLEKAIKDKNKAGLDQRFYGMVYGNYIPYYYLGQSRFKMGDCQGAMDAWNESISQGVINKLPEFASMQEGMTACQGQVVDVTKLAGEAKQVIERTKSLTGQLDKLSSDFRALGSDQLYQREWVDRWQPTISAAQQTISDLEGRLAAAVQAKDDTAIESIQSESASLSDTLVGNMTQATNQIAAIRQQQVAQELESRNKARRELTQAVASARAEEAVKADNKVATLYSSLMELADRGEKLSADAPAENQLQMAQDINSTQRRFRVAVQDWTRAQENIARRTPPDGLKLIVTEYLAGNYENVIQQANPKSFKDERAKIQALLFRAASNYRLYVLSGESSNQNLLQAESDIREIKSMERNFSPYIPAFSPKFLDLFRRTV